MEYYTTELVLSVQEAIERAKATANTLKSPPRLYDGDSSSVHLWTDKPGRVKNCCYGEPDGGAYTIWSKMDCFILTLKVEPFIIELPISWKKRLKGWLRREKLQPELRERFELLDRAATRGWLLSTSDLALLIGLEPSSLVRHQELSRWGFTFVKCVERTGREVNWAVTHPRTDPKQLEG